MIIVDWLVVWRLFLEERYTVVAVLIIFIRNTTAEPGMGKFIRCMGLQKITNCMPPSEVRRSHQVHPPHPHIKLYLSPPHPPLVLAFEPA